MTFEEVVERFQARRVGANWMARCPAHEDSKPSLAISEEGGKILLHCHANCPTKDVLGAMGMSFEDLRQGPRIVATYDYTDEMGVLLFQVVRFEPKDFRQRKPTGKGEWSWNLNGVRRVPYRLPELLRSENILICEGEKDVKTAWEFDLTATTNPGGAGKWKDEYSEFLRGKNVTIIPDNDAPGLAHAEQVARSLAGKAASIAICRLPSGIKDLSEWPLSRESLLDLIKSAPRWEEDGSEEGGLVTHKVTDAKMKRLKWLWPERIPQGYLTVYSGDPDVGKTTCACDVIARYTTGNTWPDGQPNTVPPGNVLVLVAEDGVGDILKPRLVAAGADVDRVYWLEGKRAGDKEFRLDQDLHLLEKTLADPPGFSLVVIDPASSYLGSAKMEREQDVRRVLGPIKDLCERTGVTFLILGHFNKRCDVSALHRVGGAVANTGVPRAVWMFMKDPNGEKGDMLMLLGKGNFAKKKTGMRYRFREEIVTCDDGNTMGVPVIDWQGEETETDADSAAEAIRNPEEKAGKRAERFLREFLKDDEKPSTEILAAAAAQQPPIARRTLFRVKQDLNIKAKQRGGVWWWEPFENRTSECQ
jgi:putative DNA primase/helicase